MLFIPLANQAFFLFIIKFHNCLNLESLKIARKLACGFLALNVVFSWFLIAQTYQWIIHGSPQRMSRVSTVRNQAFLWHCQDWTAKEHNNLRRVKQIHCLQPLSEGHVFLQNPERCKPDQTAPWFPRVDIDLGAEIFSKRDLWVLREVVLCLVIYPTCYRTMHPECRKK